MSGTTTQRRRRLLFVITPTLVALAIPLSASAGSGVHYTDIAAGGGAGLTYERTPAPRNDAFQALKESGPIIVPDQIAEMPFMPRGNPGVALLDFDNDGDLDIFVTNGPGTDHSLFSNQLEETGQLTFIDVADEAGVAANDQEGSGVCFGDIDNDGDEDLYVLGTAVPNRLFENNGDGTFDDITELSEVGGGDRNSLECTMGDVDGDGLLDIYVGNSYSNIDTQLGVVADPYAYNEHNSLLMNYGDGVFIDESEDRGVLVNAGFPPGAAESTLAVGLVDYDLDGDLDIFTGGDQGGFPSAEFGGLDRGLIHIFENDGAGNFTDVMFEAGVDKIGGWMGFSFGDLNCDGEMDFFGSNFGDYAFQVFPTPADGSKFRSRWFLSNGDGTYDDVGTGDIGATPFGWGTSMADYDNDADMDIVFHGGLDVGTMIENSNPGSILANDGCTANFTLDQEALSDTDHSRRTVHGMAMGDLDGDGFQDIVSVSSEDMPFPIPLVNYPIPLGSIYDATAYFVPIFAPTGNPNELIWTGINLANGSLSVEINDGANGNNWVNVRAHGTTDITDEGVTPRDGIGAVVKFTPKNGDTQMRPVMGGASFASQDALQLGFGLGSKKRGTVEVIWPGGVKNKLYGVKKGKTVDFPEIPCSYDGDWDDFHQYKDCVDDSLDDIKGAGMISNHEKAKLKVSAYLAYLLEL